MLHCFSLRHRAQIDRGKFRQSNPHALRRKHLHCWCRTFPLREYFSSQVSLAKKPAECTTSSFQNVMKCDVDIRVNFYTNVVLSSSTTMFQEIGECTTKATDGVGSTLDVLSRACLSSVFFFSGLLRSRCVLIFPCHCWTATLGEHCTVLKQLILDNRDDCDEGVDGSKGDYPRSIDTSAMLSGCITKTMTSCRFNETLSTGIFDMRPTEESLAIKAKNRKWRASKKEQERLQGPDN